jgi:hypothetical protein
LVAGRKWPVPDVNALLDRPILGTAGWRIRRITLQPPKGQVRGAPEGSPAEIWKFAYRSGTSSRDTHRLQLLTATEDRLHADPEFATRPWLGETPVMLRRPSIRSGTMILIIRGQAWPRPVRMRKAHRVMHRDTCVSIGHWRRISGHCGKSRLEQHDGWNRCVARAGRDAH